MKPDQEIIMKPNQESIMKPDQGFTFIEHTGDIGVKVYGTQLKDLFENASKAFYEILTEPQQIKPILQRKISVENQGFDRLLVTWLSELLYLFETEQWLFQRCQIQTLSENHLEAIGWGEKYDPDRHEIKTGIKAVTYHQLSVQKVNDLWQVTIIFDI